MRIWFGEEKEGLAKGVSTLFIQSQPGTHLNEQTIENLAKDMNVKRLYFGAGKIELCNDFNVLLNLNKKAFIIILETTQPDKIPMKVKSKLQIIYRIEPLQLKKLYLIEQQTLLKLEDKNLVVIFPFNHGHFTMLNDHEKNTKMFEGDVLVYEDS